MKPNLTENNVRTQYSCYCMTSKLAHRRSHILVSMPTAFSATILSNRVTLSSAVNPSAR